MPRTQEFSADDVIQQALPLFWEKGYENVSIDDIVKATGISRYGLYGTFGDKDGLFRAVLKRYCDGTVEQLLQLLEQPGGGLSAIRNYYDMLIDLASQDQGVWGCLMCNTSIAAANLGLPVEDILEAHQERMHRALLYAVQQAQAQGQLADKPAEELANFLLGINQSIFLLARASGQGQVIRDTAKVTLALLEN